MLGSQIAAAQEPASWKPPFDFHTFSIAALDPKTGETGVAVTTRVACVGNVVPWVMAGVGAVATQARTRVEYGLELLSMLKDGIEPDEALGGPFRPTVCAHEGRSVSSALQDPAPSIRETAPVHGPDTDQGRIT